MIGASPEMLHCLNAAGIFADTTVLERQTSRLNRAHHHLRKYSVSSLPASIPAAQLPISLMGGGESEFAEVRRDMGMENVWSGLSKIEIPTVGLGSGLELNPPISRTYSSPPIITAVKNREPVLSENLNPPVGRESFKKRKTNTKEDTKEKKIKICAEEKDSKITDQIPSKNNSAATTAIRETSADISKENSKASEAQKSDYIHVRARRGQATDSHSLAERARREKISERMKYLQDLVPGCNKITGKAGMLDEIINYVQSLQKQVEFLSMKLAAVNPRLDVNPNVDEIFPEQTHPTCASKFPPLGVQSELDSPVYIHFDRSQEMISDGLRRTISAPATIPENFLVPTWFPPSSAWDVDFQSLYNVGFDQGRTEAFPSQPYTGSIELNNVKMEM